MTAPLLALLLLQSPATVAGTVTLDHLELDAPPGFVLEQNRGPDFSVYSLWSPAGGTGLGVYLGNHPNAFAPAKGVRRVPLQVGKRKVSWSLWETTSKDGERTLHAEAMAVRPFGNEPDYSTHLHVFIEARSQEGLKEMQAVVATLRAHQER